jgi:hypothetical protein
MVASSQGNRILNARSGEASRTCDTRKPMASNTSSICSRSAMSNTSSVNRLTSTTPTTRRAASTKGKAKNLFSAKHSHASITVAVCGMAMTLRIISSLSF